MKTPAYLTLLLCAAIATAAAAPPDAKSKPDATRDTASIIKEIQRVNSRIDFPYDGNSAKQLLLMKLIESVDPKDYAKVAQALIPAEDDHGGVIEILFPLWMKSNPKEACLWIKENAPYAMEFTMYDEAIQEWAIRDPRGALHALGQKPDIMNALSLIAPKEAVELAASSSDEQEASFTNHLLYNWALAEPKEAAEWMLAHHHKNDSVGYIAEAWAHTDLPGAKHWGNSLGQPDSDLAWLAIITAILKPDCNPPGDIDAAAREFNARYKTLQTDGGARGLALCIAEEWRKQKKQQKAFDWLLAFPESETRNAIIENFLGDWATDDPDAVAKAAETFKSDPLNDSVLSILSDRYMKAGQQDRALTCAEAIRDAKIQEDSYRLLAVAFAKRQPEKGYDIAMRIPEPDIRRAVLAKVFALWLQIAPESGSRTLNTLPAEDKEHVQGLMKSHAGLYTPTPIL